MQKQYKLSYLPLFHQDLEKTILYIAYELQNPDAAQRLVDQVERAILKRLENPESFEKYPSKRERRYPYYRIYVGNYIIFYVVIDDVMEVRRFLYKKRNIKELL